MRHVFLRLHLIFVLIFVSSSVLAATVSREVLVRDYRTGTNSSMLVTGLLYDSTAGTWIGTRGGIEGLPTPPYRYDGLPIINRVPLSPVVARLGWPARMAGRLDMIYDSGKTIQFCSGMFVGDKYFLSAAHCVLAPNGWLDHQYCIRPGRNLAEDAIGNCYAVSKAYARKSAFQGLDDREDDDEWVVLELDSSIGIELGWARIIPVSASVHGRNTHQLGYPFENKRGEPADTTSKTDTLCHSWAPLRMDESLGRYMNWAPDVGSWSGESGSPSFYCKKPDCTSRDVNIIGVRWTNLGISSIDSVNSGILAALLKGVKIPSSIHFRQESAGFALSASGGVLYGRADVAGQWQVMSLDGRSISSPGFGQTFSVDLANVPNGVALVVFRAPGQPPVTRRWVGR